MYELRFHWGYKVFCDINALFSLSIIYPKFLGPEEFGPLGSYGCCNIYNTNSEMSLQSEPSLNTQLIYFIYNFSVSKTHFDW